MRSTAMALALLMITTAGVLLPSDPAEARPQFARQQDKPCGYCHLAAMGGGTLTAEGKAFRKTLVSTGQRLLYFALYFLHVPFGVAWVGLFFVTFSGAWREKGLLIPPRQYLRVITYGIVIVAVSGPYIAHIRARLTPGFFGTRMGTLLLVKIAAACVLLVATLVLIWHSTVRLSRRYRRLERLFDHGTPLELTPQDLALFNGRGGRKALVAVSGRIYDVTDRNLWTRGQHPGGHLAGFDLTDAFTGAPHGQEVFDRIPAVGRLVEDPAGDKSSVRWAVLAGSAACVVILLVVSTWRWV